MPRRPLVPAEPRSRAFHFTEARLYGVTKHHLVGASWRRLGGGYYAHREVAEEPLVRLSAVAARLPRDAVFSGMTAAWLHGLPVEPCGPIEASVPTTSGLRRLAGVTLHRRGEPVAGAVVRLGLRVTDGVTTVADVASRLPLIEAVCFVDSTLHRGFIGLEELLTWAGLHVRSRGIDRLRRAITLADGAAESAMETRLRLLLVLAGLPRPELQVTLRDERGIFLARPDLYYPTHCLAIEYDGATHRDSLASDNRRQNRLVDSGYRLLRFTAGDVLTTPATTISLVRRALGG